MKSTIPRGSRHVRHPDCHGGRWKVAPCHRPWHITSADIPGQTPSPTGRFPRRGRRRARATTDRLEALSLPVHASTAHAHAVSRNYIMLVEWLLTCSSCFYGGAASVREQLPSCSLESVALSKTQTAVKFVVEHVQRRYRQGAQT